MARVRLQEWLNFISPELHKAQSPLYNDKATEDLKTAMRAKATARLGVLRALLAEITNASKTSSPISDDLSLLALIKKKTGQSQGAIEEFEKAGRQDLVEKERSQKEILEEYAGDVKVMSREEVTEVVNSVIE